MKNLSFYLGMATGILITAIVAVTSCGSSPQKQDADAAVLLQQYRAQDSVSAILATQDSLSLSTSLITWAQGECLVKKYRDDPANCLIAEPYGTTNNKKELMAFHVPKNALNYYIGNNSSQGQLGRDGIRFYFAKNKKNGIEYHTLVLVGTTNTGLFDTGVNPNEPLYSDFQSPMVYDFVQPCPDFCHVSSTGTALPPYGSGATNCPESLANPRITAQ